MALPVLIRVGAGLAGWALKRSYRKKLVQQATKKSVQEAARQAPKAAPKAAVQRARTAAKQTNTKPKGCVTGCTKAARGGAKPAAKRKVPKTYARPKDYRKGVRDKVWNAAKGKDGKVRDPKTNRVMKKSEKWDLGHKPGYEFKKHQQDAMKRGIDRKRFLDEHNNPKHYRPETISTNRGHTLEKPTGAWKGRRAK